MIKIAVYGKVALANQRLYPMWQQHLQKKV